MYATRRRLGVQRDKTRHSLQSHMGELECMNQDNQLRGLRGESESERESESVSESESVESEIVRVRVRGREGGRSGDALEKQEPHTKDVGKKRQLRVRGAQVTLTKSIQVCSLSAKVGGRRMLQTPRTDHWSLRKSARTPSV